MVGEPAPFEACTQVPFANPWGQFGPIGHHPGKRHRHIGTVVPAATPAKASHTGLKPDLDVNPVAPPDLGGMLVEVALPLVPDPPLGCGLGDVTLAGCLACRALVELSPSVTKLQCPVRQVSARQVGPGHSRLALVGAHPRSDQGVGGLQSDARPLTGEHHLGIPLRRRQH